MAITEEDLRSSYTKCFNKYKINLKNLGVEVEKFNEDIIINWFNNHLKNIEDTKK